MQLDLTDEEADALLRELNTIIENDRYPLSPRIRMLRQIRAKLPGAPPSPPRARPLIASATVITFDTVPISSATSYSDSGVTFTALNGSTFSAVPDPNGTNGLLSDPSPRIEFKATLPSGVSQVSVDLGDFDADSDLLVLRAFDAGNNLLAFTSMLIDASFVGMDTLTVSAANIAYVTFGSEPPSINGSSVLADNFTFNAAAIPEPASLALLGTSLFALGWLRRKRR